ncbi:transmembrane protein [Salix suchowensis]|nr:transmembrane protein [Salix suchowensis]
MEDHILRVIILGIISWTTAFHLLRKLLPKRSFEFCNRLVSTAHATSAVVLASLSVENWACPVSPLASKSSPSQMQALAVSLSYLIYDLICCQFDKRVSIDNTIHHLVSIAGMAAGLVYRKSGSELIAALCVTEISSPFLHLRELLKELGYRDTDLNLAADISFAAIFSFARMVFGPYITWVTVTADNPLIIKAMALGLQLVSAYWFYKIARMMSYKLTKRAASKNLVCADKECELVVKAATRGKNVDVVFDFVGKQPARRGKRAGIFTWYISIADCEISGVI